MGLTVVRLIAENLSCRRSGRRIFTGLNLEVGAGEAVMVTGRNGAGKSSLLALLSGRLKPDGGTIRTEGVGEATLPECVHVVGHRDGLKGALTALENLDFARGVLGEPAAPAREALAALGLAHAAGLPVGYLSAGQRRRVALARLLVCRRPLWLLDEPASALDVTAQATLTALMARHRAEGGLIVAATHQSLGLADMREVRIGAPPAHAEAWA